MNDCDCPRCQFRRLVFRRLEWMLLAGVVTVLVVILTAPLMRQLPWFFGLGWSTAVGFLIGFGFTRLDLWLK